MRAANLSTVIFSTGQVPQKAEELVRYIVDLESRLKTAIDAIAAGHLDKTYVTPTKPRDGDIRYADGSTWNPNSGAGVYWYNGTTWSWYAGGKTNSATIGAVTINSTVGRCNIAAGATNIVVANSLVTASSNVIATIAQNDATAILKNVVAGSGSFTINLTAAATANTAVNFIVLN